MREYVIGHYFSNCMKKIMRYLRNPELLDIEDEKENLNNIEYLLNSYTTKYNEVFKYLKIERQVQE